MTRIADVIIVGAGPSGSLLAYELAKQGVGVLILEKESLPRYKPCGGGLQVKAANLLPFDVSSVVERTVSGIIITINLRKPVTLTYPKPLVHMVMRDRFDGLLAEKALETGAALIEGERVIELVDDGTAVALRTSSGRAFEGKVVVGADGARSTIARLTGLDGGYRFGVAMESEVSVDLDECGYPCDCVKIDFGALPGGYRWVFPKKNRLSIGVGAPREIAGALGDSMSEWLAFNGQTDARRFGHLLRFRIGREPPLFRGRVLIVGEAAGLIDSLTGEGLYGSLKSARLAAPAIISALNGNPEAFSAYRISVERELLSELLAARSFLPLVHVAPSVTHAYLVRKAWPVFCRVFRGEETYRSQENRMPFRLTPKRLEPLSTYLYRKRLERCIRRTASRVRRSGPWIG